MAQSVYFEHYSQFPMDKWVWDDFTPGEIASRTVVNGRRGPKGPLLINYRAMNMLQEMRSELGVPFIVNSAYRSPEYNAFVEGSPRSKHMEGIAFDVSMHNHNVGAFVEAAKRVGFKGIGYYNTFTHIDARGTEAVWYD